MQDDKPQAQRPSSPKFNYHKLINNWDDFRKTFRSVKFEEAFNKASEEELIAFWNQELKGLQEETERISILVPAKVPKADNGEKQKASNKNSQKNRRDQKANNDVPIDQRVIDCAIKLIHESFPRLDYDFSSIFMGNDKQLLIYRRCYAFEKYIEKYRLPKSFEGPYGELMELTKELFDVKIIRNKAISTFNEEQILRVSKIFEVIEEKIRDRIQKFKPLFASILEDYKSKAKCKEMVLNGVPQELLDLLRPICLENKTVLINRFNECDNDEFKDAIVVKAEDPRLIQGQKIVDEPPPKIQYTYVEPVKLPQAPKDLRDLIFLKIDLVKQCYKYRFYLPHSGALNPVEGLFIRSASERTESYELNVDVAEGVKDVEVDIFPYRLGKSEYEIYIWNRYGITKSTEQIVLYNEMPIPNTKGERLQSYNVYLLGQSQSGLIPDGTNRYDQLTRFTYDGRAHLANDISLSNAVVICDAYGDVGGWGEMYYPSQEIPQKKQVLVVQEVVEPSLRIDTPCLLLGGKQIRKVSCGMGYCLLLSTFGSVFSMGFNHFGQLGQGNFQMGKASTEPREICKITNANSAFITDVHATICGASFATNEYGQLYRWGFNQVEETPFPIYDRFGSVINYTTSTTYYKSPNPTRIGKQFIQGSIRQIEAGNGFYFALTTEGVLYGWGQCKYLGISDLKDRQEQVVSDIINPIVLMKRIQYISVGFDHCIAYNHKNRVIAWGNSSSFSNQLTAFTKEPVDVTQEYGGREGIKFVKAGHGFTALVTKDNVIRIIGSAQGFKEKEMKAEFEVVRLQCSYDQLIGLLGRKN